ncbi:UvrD-helicase domain-containing protein [Pelagicoccus sp. SDUM812002]|uniref:UvrD-helicase domain-containing protein n=1 Tax=Pelagicoccus sp. SDUM812002 TaxID=3041266 RepID=UPI00280DF6FB|nr:UvrD-helicase domain-containing protein [Pelagicoccus sp. SDUM812002]MDQ8187746.1 UvrD-helicase domain-containing protein [Pelagicoccus sp. SDUM812002]
MELHKGTTLIEASAGTGKTYTLCRIALRLTLEHGITLDRILAVTFTEAATEELASRIQKLYQSALRDLELGVTEEPLIQGYLEEENFDRDAALNALRYSLEVFDEAPISTIHSFCKRSLDLVALETQTPFDAELSQVEDVLIGQLQSEYIRQNILESSKALSLAIGFQKNFEKRLSDIGKQSATHPEAKLRPTPLPLDLDTLERRFAEMPDAIQDLLSRKADFLPHLRKSSRNAKQLGGISPDLIACAQRGFLLAQDLTWLGDFKSEDWSKAMNKSGRDLPHPPLISLVDVVLGQIESAFMSLIYNYKSWLSERLEKAKQQANIISFNDLLYHLNRSLSSENGERVKDFLASKYDAALIDEFQDTDRVQLDIARTLFGGGEHYLFYIGDPKQAIYRFRGADIYAYFQAVEAGKIRREVLDKNYRSAPRLVAAVNALFKSSAAGFVDDRIKFEEVLSGTDPGDFPVCPSPLTLRQLTISEFEKPSGSGWYRDVLAERAANDFVARINSDANFDPAGVAFLVNSKTEANTLSRALTKRGISAAIRADRSIFQTQEASDIKQLLTSLASPTRSSLKRGAYAALDHSLTAKAMQGKAFDDKAAPIFEYLSEWSKEWFARNFDVALQGLLQLLDSGNSNALDSERRHANISQLSELLSEARDAEDLSPRGLLNWLLRKVDANVSQNDEWQTRISSDEGKPQIITVHKSKGLQFPIVFLPFLGLRRVRKDELSATYHGSDDEMIIDYSPEDGSPAKEHSLREALAEDVRLLYVALTRAERENIVYLCPEEMQRAACSSFAQFLLDDGLATSSAAVSDALERLQSDSDSCISFERLALDAGDFVKLERDLGNKVFPSVSALPLQNRNRMPLPDRVLSFSSLNRSLHNEDSENEIDKIEAESDLSDETLQGIEPEIEQEPEGISIFTLPKGTHAGDLLHLILERFDFSRPETLAATTQFAFDSLQFEPRDFEPIVAAQIGAIAKTPLRSRFGEFTLEEVPASLRIPELEFAYPVTGDVKEGILNALSSCDLGAIPNTWLAGLVKGEMGLPASMLRGFIDLVLEMDGRLYIFDWKSNYLGPRPVDYDQAAIQESMADHNYYLQYLLYCVALKRFAEWRFPGQSFSERFGGVFYIYARGISPGKETGIFYDLPSMELLESLDIALSPEGSLV